MIGCWNEKQSNNCTFVMVTTGTHVSYIEAHSSLSAEKVTERTAVFKGGIGCPGGPASNEFLLVEPSLGEITFKSSAFYQLYKDNTCISSCTSWGLCTHPQRCHLPVASSQ